MTLMASRGKMLQDVLLDNLRAFKRASASGGRNLPVIFDVGPSGTFVNEMTPGAFLAQAGQILADSRRLYRWENTLVVEFRETETPQLVLLAAQGCAERYAASFISNMFCVGVQGKESSLQSLP